MASQIGEAVIKLSFDGKNLSASLAKVEPEVKKQTTKLEKAMGGIKSGAEKAGKALATGIATGTAAATAAVIGLGKASLDAYADYEQLVGGVETLFKDSADEIFQYASVAYKTAGLSANQYMEQATSFSARLIQGLGGDTAKAAQYADKAITDMADNANKMGTSIEMIQSAYQGFAKQNYTMLDNLKLGYGGTASEMARLINDSGVLGKNIKVTASTVNSVSFDKMIEAIHKVQENLGITGTTAKEAADTISGSVNSMKSAWQNLLTGVASDDIDFSKLVDNFIESFSNVLKNIQPRIKKIAQGISKLVSELGPVIAKMLPEFVNDVFPAIVEAVIQIVTALVPLLPQILGILMNAIVQNLPTLAPVLIGGIVSAFFGPIGFLMGTLGAMLLGQIGEWLGNLGGFIFDVFGNIWNGICMGAAAAWQGIQDIFGKVAEFFASVFGAAWEAVRNVFSVGGRIFQGIVEGIFNTFRAIVNAIIGGINKVVAIPFNAINGVLSGIKNIEIVGIRPFDWIGLINVPQIPQLAEGGYARGATNAVIGEAGKEVVLPLENNTDNWAGLLASELEKQFEQNDGITGRPITVNMTNEINNEMDADDIGRKLMESIRRAA